MSKSNIEDIHPLTPTQEGILFHCLLNPASGLYWTQYSLVIEGTLDDRLFGRAWQEVVAHHPSLRTVFTWEKRKQPLQVVRQHIDLVWERLDWTSLGPEEQEQQLEAFLSKDRAIGCDLNKGPLMRFALIRLADDRCRFVWSNHHLLVDGWSLQLVLNEVLDVYDRLARGEAAANGRRAPFRNYVEWLLGQNRTEAETFFREHLAGVTTPTPLASDRPSGGTGATSTGFASERITFSAAETSQLKVFARAQKLTLNTLMQAAWGLLLYRYCGEPNILFGVTLSGRSAPVEGIESIAGLFINTLPIRFKIDPEEPVGDWLRKAHRLQADLQQFQHAPLSEVQAWSQIPRGQPLFESIFVFENFPAQSGWHDRSSGISLSDERSVERTNYPLTIAVQCDTEIIIQATYDTSRFEAASMRRRLSHMKTLLDGIAANPAERISRLPLLSNTERHQLLVEWNDTARDYPRELCVHQLFEAQVARTPAKMAVAAANGELTFAQLNGRANQLAHHLRRLGVGPETMVGICVERSIEMVVGLLSILKAGGAYMPMDPFFPKDRLAFMLDDADVGVLLTQKHLLEALPTHKAKTVCLDTGWNAIARESTEKPNVRVTAGNLAYVIYTSGSTGKPKGVQIPHGAVVNFLNSMRRKPGLNGDDVLLAVTTLSFDIAGLELHLPLSVGAKVVVASQQTVMDGPELIRELEREKVTVLQATPATWRVLLASGWRGDSRLKILCGGEALPPDLADELLPRCAELWNMYGPTETTIWSTCCRVLSSGGGIHIGRPIDNTAIYILDSNLQPVPVGITGELFIGGDGLARGYLNRPELTAEKFVADPFGREPGARLYRTGDLARYLPDGNIECLGRFDHQVKIRGFRIELGEIESILRRHPAVSETAVVARDDTPGDKRLVGYVVSKNGTIAGVSDLRAHLLAALPDYMVPSAFVALEKLPLTPNGKVDRKALPAPDHHRPELQQSFVAPRTTMEKLLASIWKAVLNVEEVGIHDNFFDLGGHSLLAVRLFSRIQQALNKKFPLAILFEAPTIQLLAEALHTDKKGDPDSALVAIQTTGTKPPFFWAHGLGGGDDGGGPFRYRKLALLLGPDQPSYGLRTPKDPFSQIEEMAATFVRDLRKIQPEGPYYLGGYCMAGVVAYEMARQLRDQDQEVALLVLIDSGVFNHSIGLRSLTPKAMFRYGANFVFWAWDILRNEHVKLSHPAKRLLYLLRRTVFRRLTPGKARVYPEIGEVLDMTGYPAEARKFAEAHWQAFIRYTPKKFDGRVTLFAPKARSLLAPDPVIVWGTLAEEGVDPYVIPGNHATMLEEPFVQDLAKSLGAVLAKAQGEATGMAARALPMTIQTVRT